MAMQHWSKEQHCWLCSASADVMMGHVYGASAVALLVSGFASGFASCAVRTVMAGRMGSA